jgi:integrase
MKQHVFKRSRVVDGVRVKARTYSGRYRPAGAIKDVQVALEVTDKQVAQSKLAAIVKQAELEKHGHVAPRLQVETLAMPLDSLIADWVADMAVRGAGVHHCGVSKLNMGVLMRECGWKRIPDITPGSFISWRGASRGRSAKTLKEYLGCVRGFLNWLVRSGRLPSDPLASVGKVETNGREVRNRQAFSHEKFLRMLEVARSDRRVVYAVAYYTGLRRSEIASLCWGDFNLSAVGPTFTILAEHSKNKKRATLPLFLGLREILVEYFNSCGCPGPAVKAFKVPHRLDAFHRDLKAAGISKIDERGKVLDFHSFRHGFATRLAEAGVPLAFAMLLMRHSDPKLTAKNYVDQASSPLSGFLAMLPGMTNEKPLSLESSLESGVSGHFESLSVANHGFEVDLQSALNESLSRALSPVGATCQMEPLVGFEPTTYSLRMNCSTPELQRRLTDRGEETKASRNPQAGNPGQR